MMVIKSYQKQMFYNFLFNKKSAGRFLIKKSRKSKRFKVCYGINFEALYYRATINIEFPLLKRGPGGFYK